MVKGLDRDLRAKDRKIVLLVFNCPAHPTIEGLTNIHLVFLPVNTTSVFQTMDQGVTRSLKVLYQKRVVRELLKVLDKNISLPKVSMVDAMNMLVSSWNIVLIEAIANCFRKVGITS